MGHVTRYEIPGGTQGQREILDVLLRSSPFFTRFDADNGGMYLCSRAPLQPGEMPALYTSVDSAGVEVTAYVDNELIRAVCDHLEAGLRRRFGSFRTVY